MSNISLCARVTVARKVNGIDELREVAYRTFPSVKMRKAHHVQAWASTRFRRALEMAEAREVVSAELKGHSDDGTHYLLEGRIVGWGREVRLCHGVFDH